MYASMSAAIDEGERNPLIRVILLHGQKDFTAGNDLKDFQSPSPSDGSNPIRHFMRTITKAEKPLISDVRGYAVGIGTTMLFHFDLVYSGTNARFQLPFVSLGLCPEFGSTYLLPRLAGRQRPAEFFTAEDAYKIGLVNKVFSEENLIDKGPSFS